MVEVRTTHMCITCFVLLLLCCNSTDLRKRPKVPNVLRWEPNEQVLERHAELLSTVAIFLNKTSKCNLDRRTIRSEDPLNKPARIIEALGNPVDVSAWTGQHLDKTCGGGEGIFSRSPEYGDALVDGDGLLKNLALSKEIGVSGTSKFGTCELMPDETNKYASRKAKKGWDHPLFREVELARSLADERLLLSEKQRESGQDDEVFSALSMIVRGSLLDMEIGTAAWHAASHGSLLWFALPPGNDLPFEAWENFEDWILNHLKRMIKEEQLASKVEERDLVDPNVDESIQAEDYPNMLGVFGLESHPPMNKTNLLLKRLKICQQHEGDLIVFPENWRRWAIVLEDAMLISRRAGTGATDLRKLRDRILDKAAETATTEEAEKMARDLGLLQKIESIKYNKTKAESNPFHVKTLVAKGTALASQGKSQEAATAYREALLIDPTNMNVMHNLATNILAVKDNPFRVLQAEGLLRKVVLNQPSNGAAANALAGLLLEMSKESSTQTSSRSRQNANDANKEVTTARVAQTQMRRYRRDAVRFARQAIASIVENPGDTFFDKDTHGRWHITTAKAFLNLQKGDILAFDDEVKRRLIANGYLCKGIKLSGSDEGKTWTWEKVRRRLGLYKYRCLE